MLSNKNPSKFREIDLKKLISKVCLEPLDGISILVSVITEGRGLLRKEIFELFYMLETNPPLKEPSKYYWKEGRTDKGALVVQTFLVCPIAPKKGKKNAS